MKQLVISVHGIRTFGGWQEQLERLLRTQGADRQLTVINYKFGYFSVLAFIIPFLRWLVVRRFRRFFVHAAKSQQWDRIDLVGHSFGTHIIAWGLYGIDSATRPPVNTIVLAGSVLKSDFSWQVLIGHSVKRVVNDCGLRDQVLILSQLLVLFTGMAGRLGFNGGMGQNFRNRFFDCGHGGYFLIDGQTDDAFMQRYWVPLLLTDSEPEIADMRSGSALGGIKLFLLNNADLIKVTTLVLVLGGAITWIYGLYSNEKTQHDRAERNFETTRQLLSEFVEIVSETVRPIAQLETMDELLKKTRDLIEKQLTPGESDDPRIALQRARVYITLAEIKWERADVRGMYDLANEAIRVLDRLTSNDSATPGTQRLEAQHLLARSTGLVGLFYSASTMEADPKKALVYYQKALSQLEELAKRFDDEGKRSGAWRWLRSLAGLQQRMGELLLNKFGQLEEANQYYEKSIATWDKLRRSRPGDSEIAYEMAWAANIIGDVLWEHGLDELAFSRFREAREGIKRLGDDLSTHLRWRWYLSIVQNNIGLVLRSQQRYAQAIESFREAKAEISGVLRHDPDQSNFLGVLAWSNDNLGETRVRWARAEKNVTLLKEADDELREAYQSRLALAHRAKEHRRWQIEPAISDANIAALNGTRKELTGDCIGAAHDFHRAAVTNPIEVKDEREDDMVVRRVEFLEWAGLLFRKAGIRADAERELKEALEIVSRHTPKFKGKFGTFKAIKERLEQELRDSARYEPGACVN